MAHACQNCGERFTVSPEDRSFLERMQVPEPSLCYFCRMQRRLSHRNERQLYHRQCSRTGKSVISHFSDDKPFPVYDIDVWWSDDWDALEYGVDFDFGRPFLEQFLALRDRVPRIALQQQPPMENSAYCNCASRNKNCYLVFSTNGCEECCYGSWVNDCRQCFDNLNLDGCELCFECVGCRDCYNLRYSRDCISCADSMFLRDCLGCRDCFGCANLANQQYWLFNQPVGKTSFEAFICHVNFFERCESSD